MWTPGLTGRGTARSMSMLDSSVGGSAMQGGADYQNRVAAWMATKMLSEGSAEPIGPRGKVVYLAAETGASVDDLLVGSESGDYAFIQAKRRLSLSERENSDLASTVKQAVRQLTRLRRCQEKALVPSSQPWLRPDSSGHFLGLWCAHYCAPREPSCVGFPV